MCVLRTKSTLLGVFINFLWQCVNENNRVSERAMSTSVCRKRYTGVESIVDILQLSRTDQLDEEL